MQARSEASRQRLDKEDSVQGHEQTPIRADLPNQTDLQSENEKPLQSNSENVQQEQGSTIVEDDLTQQEQRSQG